ncbi:unnamed protein product [Linum trigynum]|uniref:Uncharacterized protein n=1 Tax=Linum trigynum TaxID=586398 RepID=A0AAV2D2C1_9ROSI
MRKRSGSSGDGFLLFANPKPPALSLGRGLIIGPYMSNLTWALLYGVGPDTMVDADQPNRQKIEEKWVEQELMNMPMMTFMWAGYLQVNGPSRKNESLLQETNGLSLQRGLGPMDKSKVLEGPINLDWTQVGSVWGIRLRCDS